MLDRISPDPANAEVTIAPRKTRRSYSKELKARIVSQCLQGDRSVASIALENGVNANLVHKWIRQSRNNHSQPMLPVTPPADVPNVDGARIELMVSGITIRLYGSVEIHSIRTLLSALQ